MDVAYVGMLVWVRRRNGSWWPGRVLGPEELPGSHLLSPRSGTPVKLLGREDASVDWYNIEKSKRVKIFRCGEFNDCIEKAKAFAGLPTKKREKYARREDAILHALELERQQIELGQVSGFLPDERELIFDSNEPTDKKLENVMPANEKAFNAFTNGNPKSLIGATQAILSTSRASLENLAESMMSQEKVDVSESELEDDITEVMPRMRGLQDFGLRIAPSKRKKANWTAAVEGVSKVCLTEDDSRTLSCISKNTNNESLLNNSKNSSFAFKRKASYASVAGEENAAKRRDRRRPLTRVLESSAKLPELGYGELDSTSKDLKLSPSQLNRGRHMTFQYQEKKIGTRVEQFTNSEGLESQSARQQFEAGRFLTSLYGPKKESKNAVLVADTSCSSFPGYVNASFCDQVPLHLPVSAELSSVAGSSLIDSLIRRRPSSTCSFLSASAHTGSAASVNDSGLDKSSCISMPSIENPMPTANFLLWSSHCFKGNLCNKAYDALGMLQHSEIPSLEGSLPCPGNNMTPRDSLQMQSFFTKNYQVRRAFIHKTAASLFDMSSLPLTSHSEADIITAREAFLSKKPATVGTLRGHLVEEDEAESLRATSALPTINVRSVEGPTGYVEQFEPLEGPLSYGSNEGRDETGFFTIKNKCIPPNEASCVKDDCTISYWQAKGRRNARGPGRRPEIGCYERNNAGFAEELEQDQEEADKQYDTGWRCNYIKGTSAKVGYYSSGNESTKALQHKNLAVGGLDDYQYAVPCSNDGVQNLSSHVPKIHQKRSMVDAETSSSIVVNCTLLEKNDLNHRPSDCPLQQESCWFDVEVDLQASYQKERVPRVSLMSKLNGKAVVGHPVVVERLECRRGTSLTGIKGRMNVVTESFPGSKAQQSLRQPTWKTARRTEMLRVPRPCTNVARYEIDNRPFPHSKERQRSISKSASVFGKKRFRHKHYSGNYHASPCKEISRKLIKRAGISLQKTRTLSSFAVGQNVTQEHIPNMPEQPSLSCIPVKLVFKRIKDVLYGQTDPVLPDNPTLLADALAKPDIS